MIFLFDLDRTLLSTNSSFAFCRYLHRKQVISFSSLLWSFFYYVWHHYFGLSLEDLHEKVFKKLLYGMSLKVLQSHVEPFISLYLEKLIYFPAWEKLRAAQHLGSYTVILSNSPSFLVGAIAQKLKVDAFEASEYKIDKDQKLCQIVKVLQGLEKAAYVKNIVNELKLDKSFTVGYSDSYLDLPFLQSVGKAVVVNPDRKLKRLAKDMGWEEI